MANERITEDIVREHFKSDPLFKVIKLEEQRSSTKRISGLLLKASKKGKGRGFPEFIISFPTQNTNYLIIVECKAETKFHRSKDLNNPVEYAVDGVLHYGKILSCDYDVICIAVSGQDIKELEVATFYWQNSKNKYSELKDIALKSISDYIKFFNNEHFSESLKQIDIIQKAIHLNETFQSYSITENSRCTIVSAVLLSLMDNNFRLSYTTYESSKDIAVALLEAVKRVLKGKKVRNEESMLGEYQKIAIEPLFKEDVIKVKKKKEIDTIGEIKDQIINYIHKNVYPLTTMDEAGYDVLGKFYTEFIRYAGSAKTQGLVLTPRHITDLFCDLADITPEDIVYDPCCGTGGFLISAMKRMIHLAGSDYDRKRHIKNHQLVGVERRPDMFTYGCSNMFFRGDGKSNIYCGDCFVLENEILGSHKPTTVFLNPPYDVGNVAQMEFIEHGLRMVEKNNGMVLGIVQMSCAIGMDKELIAIRKRLLDKNRLKAVVSMPVELFNPASSVPTCVMVWEANKPNKNHETWFGYLRDDGFEKRKRRGRIDVKKKWDGIRENFLKAYNNQKEVLGISVKKSVLADDEWCAEAYMETDYSLLKKENFEEVVRRFYSFKYIYQNDEEGQ
jgi:type I restriction-modification system DNA methylase subunit